MGRPIATLRLDGDSVWIEAPYSPQWVEDVRDNLPSKSRTYHPDRKQWSIRLDAMVAAEVILRRHFDLVMPEEVRTDDPYRQMFGSIPLDALRKLYHGLSLAFHPDRDGGVCKIMAEINGGWARIQKERSRG